MVSNTRARWAPAEHGNGIMLIFGRTETSTWQEYIFHLSDATLFLAGRIHFYLPSGQRGKSGTAPSVLLAYSEKNVDALRNAGIAALFSEGRDAKRNKSIAILGSHSGR